MAKVVSTANEGGHSELAQLLLRVGRRRAAQRQSVALGVGLTLASLWALAFAARLGVHPTAAVRALGLAGAGALPFGCALAAALWPGRSLAETAGRLRLADPTLPSQLRSAVELESGDPAFSRSLVRAHALEAARRLAGVDLASALPPGPSRAALLAGVLAVAIDLGLGLAGPPRLTCGFAALRALPRESPAMEAAREPITGDVELTYEYPAYTRLPPKTVAGTDGALSAPAGTQVKLRTRADRDVASAVLVVNGTQLPLTLVGKRELSGSLLCQRPGSYLFRLFGPSGELLAEGPRIPLAIEADAPPKVAIDLPAGKLTVAPNEVVTVRYRAEDDYGVSEVALVYTAPGTPAERRVVLRQSPAGELRLSGEAAFDLGPLHLSPGDLVGYTIEALDNDRVQGPKSARATAQTLVVFSLAEHHRDALALARALWERLILLLADRIDERTLPAGSSGGADERAKALCQDLERASTHLRGDAASPRSLALALAHVAHNERTLAEAMADARRGSDGSSEYARSRGGQRPRQGFAGTLREPTLVAEPIDPRLERPLEEARLQSVAGLERDVIYLEALLDQETMEDLVAATHELASRRRNLALLVERYRKAKTPELKAAISAELASLNARVRELMRRMAELAHGLSDEHLNRAALAELAKDRDLEGGLAKLSERLAQGDVEGMLAALDELGNEIDSMQRSLGKAAAEGGERFPGLAKKVAALEQGLGRLSTEERDLATETERLRRRYREALEQRAPATEAALDLLKAAVREATAQLARVPPGSLPAGLFGEDALGQAQDQLAELLRALGARDLDQALRSAQRAAMGATEVAHGLEREGELARAYGGSPPFGEGTLGPAQLRDALGHVQAAVPPIERVRDALSKLFPDRERLLGPGDRERLRRMARAQRSVRGRLGQVEEQLAGIERSAPLFGPSAKARLDRSGAKMEQAAESLDGQRPSPATEQERSALEELSHLTQELRQRAQAGGEAGQGPFPLPFAGEAGEGEGEGGASGGEAEKVVIPGADQYLVPAEFRRDVLDAMKQKAPRPYEEQVKRYYEELVR